MGRNQSLAWNCIHATCDSQNLNEQVLYERAKLLLGCYRSVCWATTGTCTPVDEENYCYRDHRLDTALGYLKSFCPKAEKTRFEVKIRSLFETRWMIELVTNTSKLSPSAISTVSSTMKRICWISYILSAADSMIGRRKPSWSLASLCGAARFRNSRHSCPSSTRQITCLCWLSESPTFVR